MDTRTLANLIDEASKPLKESIERIDVSLGALARIELARVSYGEEEIRRLLAHYHSLRDDGDKTFAAWQQAEGQEAKGTAMDVRRLALEAISDFQKEHPRIVELTRIRFKDPS